MVAFLSLAFIALLLSQTLVLSRIVGFNVRYFSRSPQFTVFSELVLHVVIVGSYFLGVVIFGGGCTRPLSRAANIVDVRFTGFGYIIACFLFVLISVALLFYVRRDNQCHLGPVGTSSTSSSSTSSFSSSGYSYGDSASETAPGAYGAEEGASGGNGSAGSYQFSYQS